MVEEIALLHAKDLENLNIIKRNSSESKTESYLRIKKILKIESDHFVVEWV